jgi:lysyl-tRNA synthetase class 2
LQTSPEAAMKRMVAAGAQRIYQIGPVFRQDESGQYHNLEFTMLEWYRCGDSMSQGIELLCELFTTITGIAHVQPITYRNLFQKILGVDPLDTAMRDLARLVASSDCGYQLAGDEDRDTLLDIIMGLIIQPQLQGPIVVSNYPISQAALAQRSEADPETAERFELFYNGIELANGYAELSDGEELRARAEDANRQRVARGKAELPVPERLIAAMQSGMPICSGTAVGFDRLVMIAGGYTSVGDVIPFPFTTA